MENAKMLVEVWSDVVCPYCYIGKRRLERALAGFEHAGDVVVRWRAYQLTPRSLHFGRDDGPNGRKDFYGWFAQLKGGTRDWAVEIHRQMTDYARQEGLVYDFERAVVANTFDAHRLGAYAWANGAQGAVVEGLFAAYFTEGKDIADHGVLADIGDAAGLARGDVMEMLAGDAYSDAVEEDIGLAHDLAIRGVPFYLVNGRYAVSGAQRVELFTEALRRGWEEM